MVIIGVREGEHKGEEGDRDCALSLTLCVGGLQVSPAVPEGQVRVMLSWVPNGDYTEDLDLHMLVPGPQYVTVARYDHLETGDDMSNATHFFNGTDFAEHHEGVDGDDWNQFDGSHHTYYVNKGDAGAAPYVTLDVDIVHASSGAYPESMDIHQQLPKQYLVFGACTLQRMCGCTHPLPPSLFPTFKECMLLTPALPWQSTATPVEGDIPPQK